MFRFCSRSTLALLTSFLVAEAGAFTLNSSTDPSLKGWANRAVAFRLNPANCPANIDALLGRALDIWNGVPTSDLVVSMAGVTDTTESELAMGVAEDVPVILCDVNFSANSGTSGDGIAGVAFVRNPPTGGNISYAYLLINVEPGSSGNVADADPTLAAVVLAHEIGHVLGLGHSADTDALMYFNAAAKTRLSLAQDDIDGISYLYPRDELRSDAFGCGTVMSASGGAITGAMNRFRSSSGTNSSSRAGGAIFVFPLLFLSFAPLVLLLGIRFQG